MAKPKEASGTSSQELLRQMSAGADNIVDEVIRFANNDVPDYLENLRRFEEESRKVRILVK